MELTSFNDYAPPIIQTSRLRLEPLLARHAAALFPLFQDPDLYVFLPQDPPTSRDLLEQRYSRLESRRSGDGRELWLNWVGFIAQVPAAFVEASVLADRTVQIAYFVFRPGQRQGFGKEAVLGVLSHLRRSLGATRAKALVDTRNQASIALLESCKFVRVRMIANADAFKGSTSDEYEYLREDTAVRWSRC
jgi:RimJ/RimL family protein N-acetyltransferase